MHAIIEFENELHIFTITEYLPSRSAGAELFAQP
jgi:hypothetical protein